MTDNSANTHNLKPTQFQTPCATTPFLDITHHQRVIEQIWTSSKNVFLEINKVLNTIKTEKAINKQLKTKTIDE